MVDCPDVMVVGPAQTAATVANALKARGLQAAGYGWESFQDTSSAQKHRFAKSVVLLAQSDRDLSDHEALRSVLQGTFHAVVAATKQDVTQIVVASDLGPFRRCPSNWKVDPRWAPRPAPVCAEALPVLVENSVRELIRETGLRGTVVRGSAPEYFAAGDGVEALVDALGIGDGYWWQVRHAGDRPAAPPDSRHWHDVLAAPDPIASRPIRNVVVFGAGGPMAAALFPLLRDRYQVRLTDRRPLQEVIAHGYGHQPPGSPLPQLPAFPHTEMLCDVTDPDQVMAACDGMDAVINCSVIRYTDHDHAVNTVGCWNIARAVAKNRIRRVVQTGPQMTHLDSVVGYHSDYDAPGNAAPRPGRNLYGHTKYLGAEILRMFAHWYAMEIPVLVFNGFVTQQSRGENVFETTFEESADAIVKALEVPALPSPWELITVNNDLPHGRNSSQRAWEVLGWKTSQYLEDTWRD